MLQVINIEWSHNFWIRQIWRNTTRYTNFILDSTSFLLDRPSYIETETVSGFLTWLTFRFGSPVITVRALKSTRFPIRLPRTRPSFAFNRSEIDFSGRPDFCIALGTPGNVLSYQLDITWLDDDKILQFYEHLSSGSEIVYISRRDR